ncbi:MAG: HDOD domain-containing protein [Desulfopila sp.]
MKEKKSIFLQIERSGRLPVLPEVLVRLLEACEAPDCPLAEISEIISKDPALSLRVLQLVNSAYYGFRQSFTAIEQAVAYLGANAVKSLALTTSVHQVFETKKAGEREKRESGYFWYHSLLTATLAKLLARELGAESAEDAYLAGLLHDIGKRLLASTFSGSYVADYSNSVDSETLLAREVEATGVNHCEAGAWLVSRWKLGSLVADAIEYHHEPVQQVSEAFPLVKLVYLANMLANRQIEGPIEDDQDLAQAKALFFADDSLHLPDLVEASLEEVEQVAAGMGIHIAQPPGRKVAGGGGSGGADADTDHAEEVEAAIVTRVRNMSLLATVQNELMQAEDTATILATFERAMPLLFAINKVLFFLPDPEDTRLNGRVSPTSILSHSSRSLSFPLLKSTSRIVLAHREMPATDYIARTQEDGSLADQQILTVLEADRALVVPMVIEGRSVGVIALGFRPEREPLDHEEIRLMMLLVQQVGLKLHLQQERSRRDDSLNRERMQAVATAAKKLAHEINNPLAIIGNYLITLKVKLADDPEVTSDLAVIDEEMVRISALVSQMEMFAQAPFANFTSLDINGVVRSVVQLAKHSLFSDGTTVSFIPGAGLPSLVTSQDAVKQVLINLLKNAAEAMPDGGRVIVRTRKPQAESVEEEKGVELIVADSGPGLPEMVMENLYRPFVTTKQNGHSGLGLSIVQKAVKDIGGRLSCLSSPTEGTVFTIFLPDMPVEGSLKKGTVHE